MPPQVTGQRPSPTTTTTKPTTSRVPPTPTKPSVPTRTPPAQPNVLPRDSFTTSTQNKTPLTQRLLGDNLLLKPLVTDDFMSGVKLRATSRRDSDLKLPKDAKESVKVSDVPLPTDASTPTPSQAFVIDAAMKLGFSKEVATIAVAEMARRDGNQLTIDLDSKKPLVTAEDFKKAANGGTTDAYTFSPHQVAILKDANMAAAYGMDSLDKLYAAQAEVLPALRQAAINGTDVDFDQMLKLVNDPATRDGMTAYYEAMRVTRDIGHGDERGFEALPAAKTKLEQALKSLPDGSPLKASLQAMTAQMEGAQKTLLAGTESGGKTPRAAIALMNNIANAPLGQLPDEDMVTGSIDNVVSDAIEKGANPKQAEALKGALELAYGLRANGGSSTELLDANKKKLADLAKDAGPLGQGLRPLFDKISKEATLKPYAAPQINSQADAVNNAETVSTIAGNLKIAASMAGIDGLPDALDALKNSADAIAKGNTVEGAVAGITAAPAIISGLLQLVAKQPHLEEQVLKLLGRVGGLAKGPTDLLGMYGNAKKVLYGTDLDGKKVSADDRIKAGADLALDNVPSVISTIGAISGSTATIFEIAAAPPLLIGLGQAKLMIYVMEEAGKMKGNIATHELRKRFALGDGDDAQFQKALAEQVQTVEQKPVARTDQALSTSQYLLQSHFKDIDTAARFQAFAASRLSGGRATVTALMRGEVPSQYRNPMGPNVTTKDGAALIQVAKELKALTAEFYKNEVDEVRKTLNNQGGRNRGDTYMRTEEQQKQLRLSFPNRY
ncbi:hypothetical protein [Pyxidicoccus sp. MSG2]|uniref:hypothetical protein n=1 Tax=Pyxidicoccus sp. MSG2 TaxID=2996790 RepID=UPI002271EA3B|nr:hypothetical protein [Pyxidicoccus sp. MSG2]MCY1015845.1 hypothetical protein [Pyxidicoccus sp. MSG2]